MGEGGGERGVEALGMGEGWWWNAEGGECGWQMVWVMGGLAGWGGKAERCERIESGWNEKGPWQASRLSLAAVGYKCRVHKHHVP